MQSTAGAALVISGQRFAGTALGAAFAALLVAHFGQSVEIELSVDNEQVILAIRDFGRGIPADLLPGFGVNFIDVHKKWPKIVGLRKGVLQQSIDFHTYRLSSPAVLAYELDAVFSRFALR